MWKLVHSGGASKGGAAEPVAPKPPIPPAAVEQASEVTLGQMARSLSFTRRTKPPSPPVAAPSVPPSADGAKADVPPPSTPAAGAAPSLKVEAVTDRKGVRGAGAAPKAGALAPEPTAEAGGSTARGMRRSSNESAQLSAAAGGGSCVPSSRPSLILAVGVVQAVVKLAPSHPKKRGSTKEDNAEASVAEYEETGDEPEGEWSASKWLSALGVAKVITKALKVPSRDVMSPFDYVRKLKRKDLESLLQDAQLSGLTEVLMAGVEQLSRQQVASSAQLNDKFQASGKFEMSYGSLSLFYGGLESLLGPPQVSALICFRVPSDCP